jgi:hypothetical protein
MKVLVPFKSGTDYAVLQHCTSEEGNPQPTTENLRTCNQKHYLSVLLCPIIQLTSVKVDVVYVHYILSGHTDFGLPWIILKGLTEPLIRVFWIYI